MALPGEPISSNELLTAVEGRFGLSLHRRGMAIAHKLGIRTRHLCRNMAIRFEAPRKGHRNPELAAAAVRRALGEAGLGAHDLSLGSADCAPRQVFGDEQRLDALDQRLEAAEMTAVELFSAAQR